MGGPGFRIQLLGGKVVRERERKKGTAAASPPTSCKVWGVGVSGQGLAVRGKVLGARGWRLGVRN